MQKLKSSHDISEFSILVNQTKSTTLAEPSLELLSKLDNKRNGFGLTVEQLIYLIQDSELELLQLLESEY